MFNNQWRQIAVHCRRKIGKFETANLHIPPEKVSAVERGAKDLLDEIAVIGPHSKAWSEMVITTRGVQGVRVLIGLKALAGKHAYNELEDACEVAVTYGACRLRSIRNLLKRRNAKPQQQFNYIEEHPIIRPLSDYSPESLNAFRKERNP